MTSPSTSRSSSAPPSPGPRGHLLGSWRIDVTSAAWPILIPATLFTALGVLGIGAAFVSHGPFAHNETITFVGSVLMVAGPLTAIIGLRQLLKQEEYVAALEAGLLIVNGAEETFLPWSDLAKIRWRAEPAGLCIEPREGEPIVITKPFGMIGGPELASRLEDMRRKAEFHLLG